MNLLDRASLDVFHHQNGFGTVGVEYRRNHNVVLLPQEGARNRNVAGFPPQIHFAAQGATDMPRQVRQVINPDLFECGVQPMGDEFQNVHIRLHGAADMGSANFNRNDGALFAQHRLMDLGDGSGRQGRRIEDRKNRFQVLLVGVLHGLFNGFEVQGADIVLQLSQFADHGCRQEIGPQTHDLAELDKGRPQGIQHQTDALFGAQMGCRRRLGPGQRHAGQIDPFQQIFEAIAQENLGNLLEPADVRENLYFHWACILGFGTVSATLAMAAA